MQACGPVDDHIDSCTSYLHRPAGRCAASATVVLRRLDASRPFVTVNMIQTVDGRAARDGRSTTIGGEADLQRLLDLRTMADAVLIGTGTLRAEGYDRLVRSDERRARRLEMGLAEVRSPSSSRGASTSRGRPGSAGRPSSRC